MLKLSFNPCSGGSWSVTDITRQTLDYYIRFQSLFWWIVVGDYCEPFFGTGAVLLFQSLFWWIVVGDRSDRSSARAGAVFQSLFWWIVVGDRRPTGLRPADDLVSILVLVDRGR